MGLPRDLVLYLARHEFATRVVKARGIYEAGQALGHADIKTTQRYAHLDLDDIRRAQEAAFDDETTVPEVISSARSHGNCPAKECATRADSSIRIALSGIRPRNCNTCHWQYAFGQK